MIDQQPEQPAGYELDDGRAQLRRHLQALRRSSKLVIGIVATVTAVALLLSLQMPEKYDATARLALQADGSALSSDMVQRQLDTDNALATSHRVLQRAANRLTEMTPQQLAAHVSSTGSTKANLIEITGTAGRAPEAAAIANAVAQAFLVERGVAQRDNLTGQRRILEKQLRELQALHRAGVADTSGQLGALQRRLDDLAVSEASAGSDLKLADPAIAPAHASSPRPLLATILALFASLTVAILVALAREQLSPRASGARDVGRILGVPVLAGIPEVTRGRRAAILRAAQREAFESLRTALETATPPDQQKVIVVTSATVGEGKTTVAYRLAKSLVAAGESVMLVSGDLRRPTLQDYVGLPSTPGVSDVLAAASSGRRSAASKAVARATHTVLPADPASCRWATLALLPSGEPPEDPAALLTSDRVASLFTEIAGTDYEWVLVDAPPLLGTADARVLSGAADSLLLVSRLGAVTLDQLHAERDELERLEVEPLGVVVIGTPVEAAAYQVTPPRQRERVQPRAAVHDLSRRLAGVADRPY